MSRVQTLRQWTIPILILLALGVVDASAQETHLRTLAGRSPAGDADGTGGNARFNVPTGIAVNSSGTLYVADSHNCFIREVTPAGVVTRFAGTIIGDSPCGSGDGPGNVAQFSFAQGIAVDNTGTLYVADTFNHTIRKITAAGVVSTLAGSPGSSGSVDGTGSAARFNNPRGVAVDSLGTVYVGDTNNHTIRQITAAGVVTTLAGFPGSSGSTDATGNNARFNQPRGIAIDGAGVLYVADTNNHTIRKITAGAVVTTLAGLAGTSGQTEGTGNAARFNGPRGVAVDSAGTVYVADTNNNNIRQITAAAVVTKLAGSTSPGGFDGPPGVRFNGPEGIAVDSAGVVYVADTISDTIRKITAGGVVTTVAGFYGSLGAVDGAGLTARFAGPTGVAVDANGDVYVVDRTNHTIRKVTPSGNVTTFAGLADTPGGTDGTGSDARFSNPLGIAVDSAGTVYVAEGVSRIRTITPGGVVSTLAGAASGLNSPRGIAVDSTGNLYVADQNNHTILKIAPGVIVTTLAGLAGTSGNSNGTGSAARFNRPQGVAVDATGTVYVADSGNNTIRQITPAGEVTTLAGQAGSFGSNDGTGSAARFGNPQAIAVDATGTLYVADTNNHIIRQITAGAVVTTIAGCKGCIGAENWGRFNSPQGIAVNAEGDLYVADTRNNTIRTNAARRTNNGDFDGDGKSDPAVFRPSNGTWYILSSEDNYSTSTAVAWGISTDIPVRGDFDADGKLDIAIFRPSTGTWWIKHSSTGFSTHASVQWGADGDVPIPRDYDEDGQTDVAVFRPSTGDWWALLSSTGEIGNLNWGTNGDIPVPGKYDDDNEGGQDAAIYRPSTGQWWFLTAASDYTEIASITWGISTDIPVPADYDGDGLTDIAVYRPSTGQWFILTSASDFTSFVTYTWGLSTDVPITTDFDGDGRADITAYRPSNGTWYVLTSSSNFTSYVIHNWGTGGDVPVVGR